MSASSPVLLLFVFVCIRKCCACLCTFMGNHVHMCVCVCVCVCARAPLQTRTRRGCAHLHACRPHISPPVHHLPQGLLYLFAVASTVNWSAGNAVLINGCLNPGAKAGRVGNETTTAAVAAADESDLTCTNRACSSSLQLSRVFVST